ncbi:MAG: hypothetical protein R6U96_19430 [Promethearchaeia archaeon]
MNEEEKVYLGSLNNADILSELTNDNPAYMYFICFLGNRTLYPINPNLIDVEVDCRPLMKKYDLTNFTPRSERGTHAVTPLDCNLNKKGELIFKEIQDYNICNQLNQLLNSRQTINKTEFNRLFREKFSFETNPEDILEEKIKQVREKYDTNFPTKEFTYRRMTVTPTIKKDRLYYQFKIKCACSEEIFDEINMDDYKPIGEEIVCPNCEHLFNIPYDFSCYW